jgi:L-rhamnose mutarotase
MSRRMCFALDLVDDAALIADYEAYHASGAVWPGIVADIRASGFDAMEIWRVADRLMMVAEAADDFPRKRDAVTQEVVDRWEAMMARYQKPLPDAEPGEKWLPMTRIFTLDEKSWPS